VELAIKSTEYKAKDDTVITGNMLSLVLRWLVCPVPDIKSLTTSVVK